mmetsp:Transcript_25562/g.80018  ORF Transcript_25562/g.80018 Transcript_25562/m.80018 type:complete len:243 (-) Transcript_25562:1285-2013(-)
MVRIAHAFEHVRVEELGEELAPRVLPRDLGAELEALNGPIGKLSELGIHAFYVLYDRAATVRGHDDGAPVHERLLERPLVRARGALVQRAKRQALKSEPAPPRRKHFVRQERRGQREEALPAALHLLIQGSAHAIVAKVPLAGIRIGRDGRVGIRGVLGDVRLRLGGALGGVVPARTAPTRALRHARLVLFHEVVHESARGRRLKDVVTLRRLGLELREDGAQRSELATDGRAALAQLLGAR